ncbi:MAG: hypothetical protein SOW65_02295, partial [Candidatus Enterosoma sp.]|nr:hypothetical protein [bacterium]MDY3210659.1 hypothetical protein [Candidatus Enterosoma sp.]
VDKRVETAKSQSLICPPTNLFLSSLDDRNIIAQTGMVYHLCANQDLLQNKWLNFLGLVFSIYILIISICFMFVFKFTLLGVIFGVFLTVLTVVISAFRIYINKYERKNI